MLGERLIDLRKDAGLTQEELGEILKLTKYAISAYERDRSEPPDAVKLQIARYFHVSVDYLLGLTRDPNPYHDSRSVIRLPPGFPPEARKSLYDYAEFLKLKYSTPGEG